ncbi:hypothetical protein RCL1_002273 [Eukaryota sp. TZLM3-RCL]
MIFAYILLNTFSAVSIVLLNKVLFQLYGFNFGTFLTVVHFLVTYTGLHFMAQKKMFTPATHITAKDIAPLSLAFTFYVVLNNLSLLHNPVNFYQILKILVSPTVALFEYFIYKKRFGLVTVISLILVTIGVFFATVADTNFKLSFFGALTGFSAVIVTAFYQIWSGTMQKKLNVSSVQLLYKMVPFSMISLIAVVPVFDSVPKLFTYDYGFGSMMLILGTAVLSFFVNLSLFLITGKSSAVVYNIFSHMKTILILSGGFLIFNDPLTSRILFGLVLTICGIVFYSVINIKQQQAAKRKAVTLPVTTPTEEEEELDDSKRVPEDEAPLIQPDLELEVEKPDKKD